MSGEHVKYTNQKKKKKKRTHKILWGLVYSIVGMQANPLGVLRTDGGGLHGRQARKGCRPDGSLGDRWRYCTDESQGERGTCLVRSQED